MLNSVSKKKYTFFKTFVYFIYILSINTCMLNKVIVRYGYGKRRYNGFEELDCFNKT